MRTSRIGWLGTFLLMATLAACGSENGPMEPEEDLVAPFVGDWDAVVFLVTNDADPNDVADLTIDGSFFINIQESGLYTATLTFGALGAPFVEIGRLAPSDDGFVTLRPNGGDPATSAYVFVRPDYLTLDGPTDFDFNLDGESEAAQARIELQRR